MVILNSFINLLDSKNVSELLCAKHLFWLIQLTFLSFLPEETYILVWILSQLENHAAIMSLSVGLLIDKFILSQENKMHDVLCLDTYNIV